MEIILVILLCALGVALYVLGFNFGYLKGYEQAIVRGKRGENHEVDK